MRPLLMRRDITDFAFATSCRSAAGAERGPVSALITNAANEKRQDDDEAFWDWP